MFNIFQATADLLGQLGLTYVAVVHTDDDFGRYSANKLKEISKANGICVDSIQSIEVKLLNFLYII
jgi:hypothetical protein